LELEKFAIESGIGGIMKTQAKLKGTPFCKGFIILSAFIISVQSQAQTSTQGQGGQDAHSQEALRRTQEMLRNSSMRQKALTTPQAQEADQRARQLMGSAEDTQALYELSAELIGNLVQETGGDPAKLQTMMMQLTKNPEAFRSKMSPTQYEKLKALAAKIERRNSAVSKPK
jgi:hypothetical protein